ncbi:MAG: glycosyltransferase family 4 protein [Actinomycetia bacterium]|nr:glycosyltransferase family 4 protein [Actinomycetes bacterium]
MRKLVWVHGIDRIRPPSMNKYGYYIMKSLVEIGALESYDITVDQIGGVKLPALNGLINRYIMYSLHCRNLEGDYFHIPDGANAHAVLLLPRGSKTIVTQHDEYSIGFRAYGLRCHKFSPLIVKGLRKADHVVTVSRHMKRVISGRFGISESRISAIHSGVEHDLYRPNSGSREVIEKYGLPRGSRFVLCVGSELPRKNFPNVLAAFKKLSGIDKDLYLVKVGKAEYKKHRQESIKEILKLGIENKVLFTEFVPEVELPALYSQAVMLLSPSFYEGSCGMHVLEAMACGCPVVASSIPPVVEMVGDSVLSCDPGRPDDIVAKACMLLADENVREDFKRKGMAKAAEYTWSRCAKEYLELYEDIFA